MRRYLEIVEATRFDGAHAVAKAVKTYRLQWPAIAPDGREMVEHDHRHDFQPELLRGGESPMACDDDAVAACEDGVGEPELGNAGRDLRHLFVGVGARVAGIGQQLGGGPLLDLVGQPAHAATSASRSAATSSKDWPVTIRVGVRTNPGMGGRGWLSVHGDYDLFRSFLAKSDRRP